MSTTKPVPSPAVAQAMAILRLLGRASEPMGVTAIARAAGISPSSCFNLLKTLTDESVAEFDPATKRYRLGLGAVDIARSALRGDAVLPLARTPMQMLADRYDAAVGLWRVSGLRRVTLIALSESEAAMRIHMAVGQRQPLAAGATGRALLAYADMDQVALRDLFDEVRWQTPLAFSTYRNQLALARRTGFAIDAEWANSGITTIAAALADADGQARYCLSASMFSGRHDATGLDRIGRDIADTAARVVRQVFG